MNDTSEWGTASYRPTPSGRLHMLREYLASGSGARGKAGILRVLAVSRLKRSADASTGAIPVAMRGARNLTLHLRPGTTDLVNASSYLARGIHHPPPELSEIRRIVELGTNVGAGLTALATEHPEAELVGVEPDAGNIAVARLNVEPFGSRVRLLEAAAWSEDTELVVAPDASAGEHGLTVRATREDDPSNLRRLKGLTIDALLDETFPGEEVDYMHVTIEGSERRVFAAGGDWPERVRSLRVEVHPYFDYLTEECIGQLERLGYRAYPAPNPPDKWVFAIRR